MDTKQAILELAQERGPEKSTCPSEVARVLFPADWRKHMAAVRAAAIELYYSGEVVITQKGNSDRP
jgi:hypothetical protein